jgi:sugar transferase EpsL
MTSLIVLLLSPVLLAAAGLVRLTSRGPLLFVQERGGRHGRPFQVYKFRTMRGTRRPDPKELVPLDHPEITGAGWWLRRFKIDELPQLFNVIKGDMSLVGPRPTLMDQVEAYDDFQRQRLLVRPGITGLAQTHGNTLMSWDERILYDVAYVHRCGFLLDMYILVRTVLVVVLGEKAMTRSFDETRYARAVGDHVLGR